MEEFLSNWFHCPPWPRISSSIELASLLFPELINHQSIQGQLNISGVWDLRGRGVLFQTFLEERKIFPFVPNFQKKKRACNRLIRLISLTAIHVKDPKLPSLPAMNCHVRKHSSLFPPQAKLSDQKGGAWYWVTFSLGKQCLMKSLNA